MKPRVAITLTLLLAHIVFGTLALLLHSDRLGTIFVSSIYGPLSALQHLDLPVFYFKGFYIPELTILGWIIIFLFGSRFIGSSPKFWYESLARYAMWPDLSLNPDALPAALTRRPLGAG